MVVLKSELISRKGQLPKLSWGTRISGVIVFECCKCEAIWKMQTEDRVIAEGMGERCPECGEITTNWVVDLLPLENMEVWLE